MITITCRFTFLDSCAARAAVIGRRALVAWWVTRGAVPAAATTDDCPTIRAGTAAAATTIEIVLLLPCALRAAPAVPRILVSPRKRSGIGRVMTQALRVYWEPPREPGCSWTIKRDL